MLEKIVWRRDTITLSKETINSCWQVNIFPYLIFQDYNIGLDDFLSNQGAFESI